LGITITRKAVSKSVRISKFSTLVQGEPTKGKTHEVEGIRIVTAKNPDN